MPVSAPLFLFLFLATLGCVAADSDPMAVIIIVPQANTKVGGFVDIIPFRVTLNDGERVGANLTFIFSGVNGNLTFTPLGEYVTGQFQSLPRTAAAQTGAIPYELFEEKQDIPYGVYSFVIHRTYEEGEDEWRVVENIEVTPSAPRSELVALDYSESPTMSGLCHARHLIDTTRVLCIAPLFARVISVETGEFLSAEISYPRILEIPVVAFPYILGITSQMGTPSVLEIIIDDTTVTLEDRTTLRDNIVATGSIMMGLSYWSKVHFRASDSTLIIGTEFGLRAFTINTTTFTVVPKMPLLTVPTTCATAPGNLGGTVNFIFFHPDDPNLLAVGMGAFDQTFLVAMNESAILDSSTCFGFGYGVTDATANDEGIFSIYIRYVLGPGGVDEYPESYIYAHVGIKRLNWDLTQGPDLEYSRIHHFKQYWGGQLSAIYAPPDGERVFVFTEFGDIVEYTNDLEIRVGGVPLPQQTQWISVVAYNNSMNFFVLGHPSGNPELQISSIRRDPVEPEPLVESPADGDQVDNNEGLITYALFSNPVPGSVVITFDQVSGTGIDTYTLRVPDSTYVNTTLGDLLLVSEVLEEQRIDGGRSLRLQDVPDILNTTSILNGTYQITLRYADGSTGSVFVYVIGNVTLFQSVEATSIRCSGHGVRVNGRCTCAGPFHGSTCNMTLAECSSTFCEMNNHCTNTTLGVFACTPNPSPEGCGCVGEAECTFTGCTCTGNAFGTLCELTQSQCSFLYCDNTAACSPTVAGELSCTYCPGACMNHGSCVGGSCECTDGWSGVDCSIEPPCSGGCMGGSCEVDGCTCTDGFGPMCDLSIAVCSALYCEPTERCEPAVNGVTECVETGIPQRCGTGASCSGSGTCVDNVGCSCGLGSFGEICNMTASVCSSTRCGGLRCSTNVNGAFTCLPNLVNGHEPGDCMNLYGPRCDLSESTCRLSQCTSHGDCAVGPNPRCDCDTNWFGPQCAHTQESCTAAFCEAPRVCANATTPGTVRCMHPDSPATNDGDIEVEEPPPHADGEVRSLSEFAKTTEGKALIATLATLAGVVLIALSVWVRKSCVRASDPYDSERY